ncbi:MAG: DUF3887 domain-containing protein, partial [Dokdonella sp.]
MSIRMLVLALLIGTSCAYAAPPKKSAAATTPASTPPATTDIDVDALARAKDVGTNKATAKEASIANGEQASPTPSPTCEALATTLLDAIEKGDFAAATKDFDPKMHKAVPAAKLKKAWKALAKYGALQTRGQSHLTTAGSSQVVTIPLVFEKANFYAQTACGSDGRIAGFYIKPLDEPAANAGDASSANPVQTSPAPTATDESAPVAPVAPSAEPSASPTADDPSSAPMSPQIPDAQKPEVRLAAACEARATALLDAAQKGDYATATHDFDAKMRSALPVAKFKQA